MDDAAFHLRCQALEELVSKACQVLLAMEMLDHMLTGCPPHLIQTRAQFGNHLQFGNKVLQRARLIEKTSNTINHQLRKAGDGRREDDPSLGHRFHKTNGDAFAAAGEHYHVCMAVVMRERPARNVPDES